MRRLLNLVRRDQRGTAIIEMALIAPVLALMTIGVVDMSNAFGLKLKCEQAAQRAIEKVMNTTADDTVEATLQEEAAEQAEVPLSNVTVTFRLECNGAATEAEDCAPGETMAQWIDVRVKDEYTPMFPVHFEGIDGGVYEVEGRAGIRIQ
jgi:Flp pilus assembly pilin Flp